MNTEFLSAWLLAGCSAVWRRITADGERTDRGDVPGWVMITVMTAALVVAILVPFRTAIVAAVSKALSDVTGA